jgi:DNA-binding CsgD family transcriptional regulator
MESKLKVTTEAKAFNGRVPPDLLDLLSAGEPPAFANDQNHRIVFWNKGAERLVGRTAAEALGRLCHEVFKGRDYFGNAFCGPACAVSSTLERNEPMNRFEITIGDRSRRRDLGMTILGLPGSQPGHSTAVHILDPVDAKSRLARELARLVDQAAAEPAEHNSVPIVLRRRSSAPMGNRASETVAVTELLSRRELDVLRAMASGQSNKDIAKALQISISTTRNHIQHILKKLNVHSKLEAVALGFRAGWV